MPTYLQSSQLEYSIGVFTCSRIGVSIQYAEIDFKGRSTHVETGKRRMVNGVIGVRERQTKEDTLEGVIAFLTRIDSDTLGALVNEPVIPADRDDAEKDLEGVWVL